MGYEFSGEVGFTDTIFMWVQNHQVAPAAEAVACVECHTDSGRLDFAALGYAEEEVTKLSVFPPADPVVEEVAAPTEEVVVEAVAAEESAMVETETAPSGNPTVWTILVAVLVVIVVAYFVFRGKKAEYFSNSAYEKCGCPSIRIFHSLPHSLNR